LDPKDPSSIDMIVQATFQSGILPPASELQQYELAIPGAGAQIIRWADDAQRQRQDLRERDFDLSQRRMNLSQRNALIIALSGLILGSVVAVWGSGLAASVIVIVAVGGPSAASVLARMLKQSG
jgi:uncharacterized membrane protein